MITLYQLEQRQGEGRSDNPLPVRTEAGRSYNPLPGRTYRSMKSFTRIPTTARGELDEDLITHRLGILKELRKGGMLMMVVVMMGTVFYDLRVFKGSPSPSRPPLPLPHTHNSLNTSILKPHLYDVMPTTH